MTETVIRNAHIDDYKRIIALNASEVQYTSPMDMNRLHILHQLASYHRVVEFDGRVAAFLLAMRENCLYQNENYDWFSSQFPKFLYIDRIVVAAEYSGLKIGTALYQDVFNYAQSKSIPIITCEYNIIPPNKPSHIFHNKFGFKEVGTQWLAHGTKKVSLQAADV
ncbi:MAG: GNAT family N-acetyltransferase [Bacteroidetes bacterium]|nr:GNAT family N-acetyltransferase [Bacteroidota bacterium]